MTPLPAERSPPLWPLALAAALFLVRVEAQLILLAIAVAALLYAAASLLAERPAPERADDSSRLVLRIPGGLGALLAVSTLFVLFANARFSTLPSTSLWFAWNLGLFPLGYLLGLAALARAHAGSCWRWPAACCSRSWPPGA